MTASLREIDGLATFAPAVRAWRQGNLDHTVALLKLEAASSVLELRATAWLLLGDVHAVLGELEDALLFLRLAAGCGHPEIAPIAACLLGHQLAEGGDVDGAEKAYQHAIESGHRVHAARARCYLAELYSNLGEGDSALAVLGVAEAMPVEIRGWAVALLGDMRFSRGDLDGACAAYWQVAETDPGDPGDRATVMLAALIELRHGVRHEQEKFAELERSTVVSAERSAYVRATIERWHGAPDGSRVTAAVQIDPHWLAYGEAAVRFYRERNSGAGEAGPAGS